MKYNRLIVRSTRVLSLLFTMYAYEDGFLGTVHVHSVCVNSFTF